MLFDGLRSRIYMLRCLLRAFPNRRIRIHQPVPFVWGTYAIGFSEQDTIWSQLLSLPGWGREIVFVDLTPNTHIQSYPQKSIKGFIQSVTRNSILLTTLRRTLARGKMDVAWEAICPGNNAVALVLGGGINWLNTLSLFRAKGWRIIFAEEAFFGEGSRDFANLLHRNEIDFAEFDSKTNPHASYDQISFYPILRERFHWILTNGPRQFHSSVKAYAKIQKRYNVKLMLRSESPTGLGHTIEASARNAGCKVIQWQHGMVTHHREVTEFMDSSQGMCSDYMFVYGDAVKREILEYRNYDEPQVVSIGSAAMDNLALTGRPHAASHVILYATTGYYKENWYFGYSPPLSDIHLYRDQKMFVNLLRQQVTVGQKAILKLHPGMTSEDSENLLKSEEANNIRIVRGENTFSELLAESDVVVLDFPSTTLLQSIRSGLPVFVLMRHLRYPPEARRLLEQRAVCSESAAELSNRVQEFLKTGDYPADLKDDQFIKAYGTHLNDGQSAQRAVDFAIQATTP